MSVRVLALCIYVAVCCLGSEGHLRALKQDQNLKKFSQLELDLKHTPKEEIIQEVSFVVLINNACLEKFNISCHTIVVDHKYSV